ncbi:hypothetical protein AtEden1_Chr3g0191491 [Arabidopsis thaliana]
MENDGASTVCPLDLGSQIFLSGDDFEPASVLFPHAAFHFPPKDKKEAYDFMDKRLGFKRQTLEACIARVERKVRAMESDPSQSDWRKVRGQDPDYASDLPPCPWSSPSEEDDEEEDSNHWKRVKNEPEVDDKNEASTSKVDPAMK